MSFATFLVGLRLEGRPCLVVGSSAEAANRARSLSEAGAVVRVVAEEPSAELRALGEAGAISLVPRAFEVRDLDGVWLAVYTDRDRTLAERIHELTETRGIFFCAVDQPGVSSYSHLGIARAGALSIAIGTGGRAPALTRRLREELERVLSDSELAAFVDRLGELREQTPPAERARVLGALVEQVRFEGKLVLPDIEG
jgi:siroheme synthase-like protein